MQEVDDSLSFFSLFLFLKWDDYHICQIVCISLEKVEWIILFFYYPIVFLTISFIFIIDKTNISLILSCIQDKNAIFAVFIYYKRYEGDY